MQNHLAVPKDDIAAFCQKHHIRRRSLFGSVLREDFGPDSDVDVLVDFEPGHVPGFLNFAAMKFELEDILKREVDLHTPNSLSRYFRHKVLATAEPQYEHSPTCFS